jgi:hypothetical protein
MFCGFCDQPCDDSHQLDDIEVKYCGQRGESSKTTFYCDEACVFAQMRQEMEPDYRFMIQKLNDITLLKKSKTGNKEIFTYILTIKSLLKYLLGCLERKSRQELKILLRQTKRLFQEVFVYEMHIDTFSKWNTLYLNEGILDAWAK